MLTTTKTERAIEVTKAVFNNKAGGIIKLFVPPFAEVLSFLCDLGAQLIKDENAWKKTSLSSKKELVREKICEYAVILNKKIFICREISLMYAVRGKNRREPRYRYTYRELTQEDLQQEEIRKQIEELGGKI
jgi:hypothetical protein